MPWQPGRNATPDPDEVNAALQQILASSGFRSRPRLSNFLRFVVQATLAGRGDRLKGYTIGVEALGRGEDFDPQQDPIVRVEAVRLRRALAQYYADEGAGDPVVIELPRGRYVPTFGRTRSAGAAGWRRVLRALQRALNARMVVRFSAAGAGLPLGGAAATTPANRGTAPLRSHGRQVQQAESSPAARLGRSGTGRDRRDAADDRADPRGL